MAIISADNYLEIMENIDTVFLDMDDVISDWSNDAALLVGVDPEEMDWIGSERALYDFVGKNNLVDKINSLRERFFSNMSETTYASDILSALDGKNYYILTAPMLDCPWAWFGKIEWCKKRGINPRRVIITSSKEACANERALLIDDRMSNCDAFIGRGGHAILFPSRYYESTLSIDTIVDILSNWDT